MPEQQGNGVATVMRARGEGVRDWQRRVPYAAVAWSLVYAALGEAMRGPIHALALETSTPEEYQRK